MPVSRFRVLAGAVLRGAAVSAWRSLSLLRLGSARHADDRHARDAAYSALQRIPALTPDAMFRAPRARLTTAIALAGPYQEQRLAALLGGVARFRREPRLASVIRGPLRGARRMLQTLPRLADGSATRLLLFGGNHPVMPIDRDTVRLCVRLGDG